MKTRQITERIGERVGDIDWTYDFASHFGNYCTSEERRAEICKKSVEQLRMIADAAQRGVKVIATTDGGWPRIGWNEVIDIGMYDGWPYWKPVPSVLLYGPIGAEWRPFSSITGAMLGDRHDPSA